MPNKNGMNWKDFIFGAVTGAAVVLLFSLFALPNMVKGAVGTGTAATEKTDTATDSKESEDDDEADLKMYDTSITEWDVNTSDGTALKFYTPAEWFSLADQYNDGLIQYYGKELESTGIACVGDAKDQYDAKMIINARPMSEVAKVLQTIYEDEYNEEEMLYSDTYLFFKDGKEPAEGQTVEELEAITANGHTYRVFKHGYDTEYYTNEEQTETTTVHTDEIVAYSDTEDPVEIIMFMAEFDQEAALSKLKEFFGAE